MLARAISEAAAPTATDTARLLWRILLGLRNRAGIEPTMAIVDKLLARFRGISTNELAAFVTRLETQPTNDPNWLDVISAMTVHETVFMRDPAQMEMFANTILPDLIGRARHRDRCIRLGSAGCSTGEEAYSIAMLTIEALVAAGEAIEQVETVIWRQPWRIQVTGCDIVPGVLERARLAAYRTAEFSSFRALPQRFLRFLPADGPGRRKVRRDISEMVRFQLCNLAHTPPPGGPFDALFCRNVLIYFSAEARRFTLGALGASLQPGGWLLLGSTDRPGEEAGVDAVWGHHAVAYRRKADKAAAS